MMRLLLLSAPVLGEVPTDASSRGFFMKMVDSIGNDGICQDSQGQRYKSIARSGANQSYPFYPGPIEGGKNTLFACMKLCSAYGQLSTPLTNDNEVSETATIGNSLSSNIKIVAKDDIGIGMASTCTSTVSKANWKNGGGSAHTFTVASNETHLTVTRTDEASGWDIELRIACTNPYPCVGIEYLESTSECRVLLLEVPSAGGDGGLTSVGMVAGPSGGGGFLLTGASTSVGTACYKQQVMWTGGDPGARINGTHDFGSTDRGWNVSTATIPPSLVPTGLPMSQLDDGQKVTSNVLYGSGDGYTMIEATNKACQAFVRSAVLTGTGSEGVEVCFGLAQAAATAASSTLYGMEVGPSGCVAIYDVVTADSHVFHFLWMVQSTSGSFDKSLQ